MNLSGIFLLMAYLIGGTAAVALIFGWILKRFDSPKHSSPKSRVLKSDEPGWRKDGNSEARQP